MFSFDIFRRANVEEKRKREWGGLFCSARRALCHIVCLWKEQARRICREQWGRAWDCAFRRQCVCAFRRKSQRLFATTIVHRTYVEGSWRESGAEYCLALQCVHQDECENYCTETNEKARDTKTRDDITSNRTCQRSGQSSATDAMSPTRNPFLRSS